MAGGTRCRIRIQSSLLSIRCILPPRERPKALDFRRYAGDQHMNEQAPIRAGVIGFGYWGPNLARNVAACEGMELTRIAEPREDRQRVARRAHPGTAVTSSAASVFSDPAIQIVLIATPAHLHAELVRAALDAGKHVLVEKPLTTNSDDAAALVALAARKRRRLLVDHTFLFTGAVRQMRLLVAGLGELLYLDTTRTNLGTVQHGTDVLWDLAPHDLSILLSLAPGPVASVSAVGACHAPGYGTSMAYVTLRFASGVLAHLHLNWIAPAKVRRTIVGGSRRMLVFDDIEASEKLKVYDSAGATGWQSAEDELRRLQDLRIGDVVSPRLDETEALAVEIAHVAEVLAGRAEPVSDGALGLRVVRLIEAAQRSLKDGGVPLAVEI
jgi:predicted dehydrogenase